MRLQAPAGATDGPDLLRSGRGPRVRRLVLADFRSYSALDLKVSGEALILTGENGAGKTNLLEALSFLTLGRGLRRAALGDCARIGGSGGWAVSVEVEDARGVSLQLGTGIDPPDASGPGSRRYRIDRLPVGSARAFADHMRVVWLTPAMDGLFTGPAAERRRFLDRMVLTIDADHGARVNALDRALRNRNRILEEARHGSLDRTWADAAEREVAELGVAVAAARHETVTRLSAIIALSRAPHSAFPWAEVALDGTIEALVAGGPALDAEERYRSLLREARPRDAASGRTSIGPHLSDLLVRHGPKDMAAALSSTGEQKALLVGLVLAQARLVDAMSGRPPLVLLDEVAAHFDPLRRAALFEALQELGGQVVMTGADPTTFAEARGAERLDVVPGAVRPAG
jgi:DNA replication and repair protein RecF